MVKYRSRYSWELPRKIQGRSVGWEVVVGRNVLIQRLGEGGDGK